MADRSGRSRARMWSGTRSPPAGFFPNRLVVDNDGCASRERRPLTGFPERDSNTKSGERGPSRKRFLRLVGIEVRSTRALLQARSCQEGRPDALKSRARGPLAGVGKWCPWSGRLGTPAGVSGRRVLSRQPPRLSRPVHRRRAPGLPSLPSPPRAPRRPRQRSRACCCRRCRPGPTPCRTPRRRA